MKDKTRNPNPKSSRHTLNRLALALLALAIGLAGNALLREKSVWDGLLLLLLGTAIFWRAATTPSVPPKTAVPTAFVLPGWRRSTGTGLMALAVLLSLLGMQFFDRTATLPQAWQFYAAGIIALIAAALTLTPADTRFAARRLRSPVAIALGIILLLALALRVWQYAHLPFGIWYDEAEAGLQARRWLSTPLYKPAFYDPINISGQMLWLYSLALRYFSDTVWGMRLVSVGFGLGGVSAAFLLGRELRGARFGLIFAFLLAVMRWDVNFSRIAMTGIDTPFFELLSLFFLTRALKRGTLRDAVFAGLTIGWGLTFYTAFRLFIAAVGIFAILGIGFWKPAVYRQKRLGWQLLALGIAVWIAAMPVIQYAARHSDSYWYRVRTTSILNHRDDPNLPHALLVSTERHLKMFHIHGDNNGRHNLPGEPELDPLMGVLFVFGLALALKNLRRAENSFFLLLLPIGLLGGILSLDFEAPQSLRTIAVLPAVAYFSALPLLWFAREGAQTLRPIPLKWQRLPAVIAGLYLLGFNAHTYFVRQANNFSVWNAFSTPETITGREMARLGADTDFFLSPFLANHPTIEFLAPDALPHTTVFTLPDALPVRTDARRPAALFIHPDDSRIFKQAQQLYPAAKFITESNRSDNPPAVLIAELSPADIAAVQGIGLTLWQGTDTTRPAQQAFRAESLSLPEGISPAPPFTAVWEGTLYAPKFGTYRFQLASTAQTALEIDGFPVLNGAGNQSARYTLAQGNHHLRAQATFSADTPSFSLQWEPPGGTLAAISRRFLYVPPVSAHGLLGEYFAGPNLNGTPALARIDPLVDIYFHLTPLPRPYSVRWHGSLIVPQTGIYHLQLRSVGEAELRVDGESVLHTNVPNVPFEQVLSLSAGLHPIEITFVDNLNRSQIHLAWIPPGETIPRPIPSENLLPPTGGGWQPFAAPTATIQPQPVTLTHRLSLADGLRSPRDVTVGANGTIFVADTGAAGVHLFAPDGAPLGTWTDTPDGEFLEPLAVVRADDGSIWVLDSSRQKVYGFAPDGTFLRAIGSPEMQLYHPRGLSLLQNSDGSATLAIANTGTGNIVFAGLDGTVQGTLGTFGDAPGQLNEPVDVLRDAFGGYIITEGANANRWQRLDVAGNVLGVWKTEAPVALDGSHLAAAPDGSVFMTNSLTGVVQHVSPDGSVLDAWHTLDGVTFQQPVGVYFDAAASQLFVTDVGTGSVHIFDVAQGE